MPTEKLNLLVIHTLPGENLLVFSSEAIYMMSGQETDPQSLEYFPGFGGEGRESG